MEMFSRSRPVNIEAYTVRSMPSQRPAIEGTFSKSVMPSRTAPAGTSTWTLLFRKMGPVRYRPAGKTTLPPPALAQVSTAFWIPAVQTVFPSPAAPKSATLNTKDALGDGFCALRAIPSSAAAKAGRVMAAPTVKRFMNSRRSLISLSIVFLSSSTGDACAGALHHFLHLRQGGHGGVARRRHG